ncbi:unnamed protein product, partial [Prorocentrum cordatum]
ELHELALSLGGLLDAKASRLRQALQTLAQMESDFATRRARRRRVGLRRALLDHGAALSAPSGEDAGAGEELGPSPDAHAAELRRAERRRRREDPGPQPAEAGTPPARATPTASGSA